jgi:pimeloyl-ACP methyl ester carboxylesterase
LIEKHWGTGRVGAAFFPASQVNDDNLEDFAASEMASASPGAVIRLLEMDENIDVRAVLSTISVPTLVVHATGDTIVPSTWRGTFRTLGFFRSISRRISGRSRPVRSSTGSTTSRSS